MRQTFVIFFMLAAGQVNAQSVDMLVSMCKSQTQLPDDVCTCSGEVLAETGLTMEDAEAVMQQLHRAMASGTKPSGENMGSLNRSQVRENATYYAEVAKTCMQ